MLLAIGLRHRDLNLGLVEPVDGQPATMSHMERCASERAGTGIPEGLSRYSNSIEVLVDLIADLKRAVSDTGGRCARLTPGRQPVRVLMRGVK